MSLKEWKNNELNGLLLKKFGILKESVNEEVVEEIAEAADCTKCEDECKCEEMNEEVVEEETELQEMDRSGEDETFNDPEGAADRYRNRQSKGEKMAQQGQDPTPRSRMPAGAKSTMGRFPNLQETLKRFAKAKSIKIKK